MASGQTFQLRAGAGTTLENYTYKVQPGGTFIVEVWYVNPHAGQEISGGYLALAFDRTAGVGSNATGMDGKLYPLSCTVFGGVRTASGEFAPFGRSLDVPMSVRSAATTTSEGNNYVFISGAPRPLVGFQSISPPIGARGRFEGDLKVDEFEMKVTDRMSIGEIYGDELTEAGLFMAHQGRSLTGAGPQTGSSGWHGTDSAYRVGTNVKYMVEVVPEPASILVVIGSLAAFARRRRGK